ncbi:hypothetical protein ACOMHN_059021 [Nucella lapillus]
MLADPTWSKQSSSDQFWASLNYNLLCEPELLPQTADNYASYTSASASASPWPNTASVPQCTTCGMTFNDPRSLRRHQQTMHLRRSPHQCSLCGKTFTRSESLKDHINGHRNIKAHQCLYCSRQFVSRANLRKHLRKGFCDTLKKTSLSFS